MRSPTTSPRFHALDRLRATAMLLGVVYHALVFRVFAEGAVPDHPGPAGLNLDRCLELWLHSFRMPLFFLISGFFGRMMLARYGVGPFLRKRWSRVGTPMVLGMVTFGPAYVLAREAITSRAHDVVSIGSMNLSLVESDSELSRWIFGDSARLFHLNHLWFLWYLLVFVTLTPWVSRLLGWVIAPIRPDQSEEIGSGLVRSGFLPVVVGLVSAPALILASGPSDWRLGDPAIISLGFPDFLIHPDRLIVYYYLYFLAGWWLNREQHALAALSRGWLPRFLWGGAALGLAIVLGGMFKNQQASPYYSLMHALGLTFYSLGSAATGFAFLGFFQRYLDRPSRAGRYLADTSLWVYLVHQPLVPLGLAVLVPCGFPWWIQTVFVTAFSVLIALLLYETVVRPTCLARLFGPSIRRAQPMDWETSPKERDIPV